MRCNTVITAIILSIGAAIYWANRQLADDFPSVSPDSGTRPDPAFPGQHLKDSSDVEDDNLPLTDTLSKAFIAYDVIPDVNAATVAEEFKKPKYHDWIALNGVPPRFKGDDIGCGMFTKVGFRLAFKALAGMAMPDDVRPVISHVSSHPRPPDYDYSLSATYICSDPSRLTAIVDVVERDWRAKYDIGEGASKYTISKRERIFVGRTNGKGDPPWSDQTNEVTIADDDGSGDHFRKTVWWDIETGLLQLTHWEGDAD